LFQQEIDDLADLLRAGVDRGIHLVDDVQFERKIFFLDQAKQFLCGPPRVLQLLLRAAHQFALFFVFDAFHIVWPETIDFTDGAPDGSRALLVREVPVPHLVRGVNHVHSIGIRDDLEITQRHDMVIVKLDQRVGFLSQGECGGHEQGR
jgi:hypothetical protein